MESGRIENEPKKQDRMLYDFFFEACEYFSSIGYCCKAEELYISAIHFREDINLPLFLKTHLVHTRQEYEHFDADYETFVLRYFDHDRKLKQAKEKHLDAEKRHKQALEAMESNLEKLHSRHEKLALEQSEASSPYEKKAKEMEESQKSIQGLKACLKSSSCLKDLPKLVASGKIPDHEMLMKELQSATILACKSGNYKQIMNALKKRMAFAKSLSKIESSALNLTKTIKEIQRVEKRMESEQERFEEEMRSIYKEATEQHREQDHVMKNAVHSSSFGELIPAKAFGKMSEKEKQMIRDYIEENTKKFRTRLSRKIRCDTQHKLDISQTIKKACSTGGIPMRLAHQKPVRQKTKLLMFLDVSGSCKNASEMMLTFMHAMRNVFPGGCSTYAFTNTLYDISGYFDIPDSSVAVNRILNAIPRSGAYSDYGRPFKQFYEEHMSEVTGDTYVYFIGDARNNKNAPGDEYVKAIARRARKSYWLNTDPIEKWNQGDSIIRIYSRYMTEVVATETPAQLLNFILQ